MANIDYSVYVGNEASLRKGEKFKWYIPGGAFVAYSTDKRALGKF